MMREPVCSRRPDSSARIPALPNSDRIVVGRHVGGAAERLRKAPIDEVIVTDSIPIPPEKQGAPITVLSVAPLLAEAIIRVHENRSVSELFR